MPGAGFPVLLQEAWFLNRESPRDDLMREKIAIQQERTGERRGGAGLRF